MNNYGQLHFQLLDYWHCGAGHGAGRLLDAAVAKTPAGLPYIPGRTVKGLMRDVVRQAERWGHLAEGTTEALFGSESQAGTRFDSTQGALRFSDARLPEPWERYAASDEGKAVLPSLYEQISTTSLDEHRIAKERTLRRVEVSVPCTLISEWTLLDEGQRAAAHAALTLAAPLLRHLGSSRHRGFGLVDVTVSMTQGV